MSYCRELVEFQPAPTPFLAALLTYISIDIPPSLRERKMGVCRDSIRMRRCCSLVVTAVLATFAKTAGTGGTTPDRAHPAHQHRVELPTSNGGSHQKAAQEERRLQSWRDGANGKRHQKSKRTKRKNCSCRVSQKRNNGTFTRRRNTTPLISTSTSSPRRRVNQPMPRLWDPHLHPQLGTIPVSL